MNIVEVRAGTAIVTNGFEGDDILNIVFCGEDCAIAYKVIYVSTENKNAHIIYKELRRENDE